MKLVSAVAPRHWDLTSMTRLKHACAPCVLPQNILSLCVERLLRTTRRKPLKFLIDGHASYNKARLIPRCMSTGAAALPNFDILDQTVRAS